MIIKKRFLLIGTGAFVEQTILPALIVLNEKIEITCFLNKSAKVSKTISDLQPNTPVTNNLLEIDFSNIDYIFCCLPLNAVVTTIEQLLVAGAATTKLIITTPVLPLNQLKSIKTLNKFKATFAFEFTPFIKKFTLAKALIKQNKIGKIKRIWLPHSGFLYHGMAQIRSLTNGSYPWYSKTYQYGKHHEYHLRFNKGITASFIEPRDYSVGKIMIAGTKGIISDYPLTTDNGYEIASANNNGQLTGFTINQEVVSATPLETHFFKHLPFKKLSNQNIDKQINILASVELFNKLLSSSCQKDFLVEETISENLHCRMIRKIPFFFDPLAFYKKAFIRDVILKLLKLLK